MTTTVPQYQTLTRSMPVLEVGLDGNELEAIFVPWDRTTTVFDPDEPEPYEEGFRRGAFDVQLKREGFSPATIPLLPRHGSTETFGHTRKLADVEAGLHGVVAIRPSLRDDIAQMVADGIDSVSIEFHPLQRRPREIKGVRWREFAVLQAVAMTPSPAYADAKVLALRADDEIASLEKRARIAELEAEIAELRAGGDKWRVGS